MNPSIDSFVSFDVVLSIVISVRMIHPILDKYLYSWFARIFLSCNTSDQRSESLSLNPWILTKYVSVSLSVHMQIMLGVLCIILPVRLILAYCWKFGYFIQPHKCSHVSVSLSVHMQITLGVLCIILPVRLILAYCWKFGYFIQPHKCSHVFELITYSRQHDILIPTYIGMSSLYQVLIYVCSEYYWFLLCWFLL